MYGTGCKAEPTGESLGDRLSGTPFEGSGTMSIVIALLLLLSFISLFDTDEAPVKLGRRRP